MNDASVKIVELEPLRVASSWAFGPSPEQEAWNKLAAWAGPMGLLAQPQRRVFGFNNPNPSAGTPNYGYEFWLTLDPAENPGDDMDIKEFGGGLYAVMPCTATGDLNIEIPAAWHRLDAWAAENGYSNGSHQWLEEHTLDGHIAWVYYPVTSG